MAYTISDSTAFLHLLQSALYDHTPDASLFVKGVDWKAIFEDARRQTVTALVAEAASRLPQDLQPSQQVMARLRMEVLGVMSSNSRLNHRIAEVSDFYASHGIRGVLLKGQGVARYYPKPELRQCGDIDLYVGADAFPRAMDLAVEEWQGGNRDLSQETYKHYELTATDTPLEIHRQAAIASRPWKGRKFRRWLASGIGDEAVLDKIQLGGSSVSVPTADFDALYIFFHAFKHLIGGEGLGLRQLCDWAMVLHSCHGKINLQKLRENIDDLGLMRPWLIMGTLLVEKLGLPAEEMPFYNEQSSRQAQKNRKRAIRLFQMVMARGNFGHFADDAIRDGRKKSYLARKFETLHVFTASLSRMWYLSPTDAVGNYLSYTVSGAGRIIRHPFLSKK